MGIARPLNTFNSPYFPRIGPEVVTLHITSLLGDIELYYL